MHLRGGGGPLRPPYFPCEANQPEIHKPNPREKQGFNLFKSIFKKKRKTLVITSFFYTITLLLYD